MIYRKATQIRGIVTGRTPTQATHTDPWVACCVCSAHKRASQFKYRGEIDVCLACHEEEERRPMPNCPGMDHDDYPFDGAW